MDGALEGTGDGLADGDWLGFREGDWLGLDEGCGETNDTMKRGDEESQGYCEIMAAVRIRYPQSRDRLDTSQHIYDTQHNKQKLLTAFDDAPVGAMVGLLEGDRVGCDDRNATS